MTRFAHLLGALFAALAGTGLSLATIDEAALPTAAAAAPGAEFDAQNGTVIGPRRPRADATLSFYAGPKGTSFCGDTIQPHQGTSVGSLAQDCKFLRMLNLETTAHEGAYKLKVPAIDNTKYVKLMASESCAFGLMPLKANTDTWVGVQDILDLVSDTIEGNAGRTLWSVMGCKDNAAVRWYIGPLEGGDGCAIGDLCATQFQAPNDPEP